MTDADFRLEAFDYDLPRELVAQEPLARRDDSRLLHLDRASGTLCHHAFRDLPDLLRQGDLLVLNRSRVMKARLLGRRPGGGGAEILLVRPATGEPGVWQALVRPGRRLRAGTVVDVAAGFQVRIEPATGDSPPEAIRRVRLLLDGLDLETALERHGHVPLPPYIRRRDRASDRERYQTVYAREPGSVAAPTAGLHFTRELLARVAERGIGTAELVLHVGPGTFRPVEVQDVRLHRIGPEAFSVPGAVAEAFARTRTAGGRVVAVGTTVTRALETALAPDGRLYEGPGETDLVVVPGFRFRAIDALVTNFHLPRSSLLLLVAAFAGREAVLGAYAEAVRRRYRFYSYGDVMLVT
jgi:S-adenosylmethionine:tRNA ribosyltransferase-isomerase